MRLGFMPSAPYGTPAFCALKIPFTGVIVLANVGLVDLTLRGGYVAPLNAYTVGTRMEVDIRFTDLNGEPADPTTVTAQLRTPNQIVSNVTQLISRLDVGVYTFQYLTAMNGLHQLRVLGSGNFDVAGETWFTAESAF